MPASFLKFVLRLGKLKLGEIALTVLFLLLTSCSAPEEDHCYIDTEVYTAALPVLQGVGIPEAKTYDPAAPGPHRAVVFQYESTYGIPEWGCSMYFNTLDLDPSLTSSSINDIELVIEIGRESVSDPMTCSYDSPSHIEVDRYLRAEVPVTIRAARTGALVASAAVVSTINDSCPFIIVCNPGCDAGRATVTSEQLRDYVLPFLGS